MVEVEVEKEEVVVHFNSHATPFSLNSLSPTNTIPSDKSLFPLISSTDSTLRPPHSALMRALRPIEVKLLERTFK